MKQKIGNMPCETCGNKVVVKENELGTLSYRCDECDAAPYAKKGTGQHKTWLSKMTRSAESQPAEPEKPARKAEPPKEAPKPKQDEPKTTIWGI